MANNPGDEDEGVADLDARLVGMQLTGDAMLVDHLEELDEKQDVANISPDGSVDESEMEPLADDYEAMKARILPELPDQETESEAVFTWKIEGWRNMAKKERGPTFQCGGYLWRVLFFPYGNNVEYASFYLEQGHEDKPPDDWYACVQFALVLWNPNDPSIYVQHSANHRFNAEEGDWGFTRFAELRKLFAPTWEDRSRPLVENNAVNVTAYLRILKDPTGVLWHNFIKRVTLFCWKATVADVPVVMTPRKKQAIYQIPTEHQAERTNSAYALQRLFYLLQTNGTAVSTQELTASFGWETKHIFEQQDVQELSRILMERMEERMKGTEAENALAKMFVGKMKTYISCINVEYESSRVEDFWDIQLNVSGNKNLDDSFRDYVQVETMDGENKYFAEGYGLQDAKKGVIFESFPQVLHLQLKRFEYDVNRDAMMKVNDRYEFPEVFDASPYLSADADKSESYLYQLHGVLVHSGDFNAGHYYAFLKPTKDGHFYKFDDDRVTRATLKEALEENFGGDYNLANGNTGVRNPYTRTLSTKRSMSAYMLVYIRQIRVDDILLEVTKEDIPQHVGQRLAAERALLEQKRKEREEQHLYLNVCVVTDDNFKAHQGFDLSPWEAEPGSAAAPKVYRILRTTTVGDFSRTVAEEQRKEPGQIRLWVMVNRQNKTIRPDQPLMDPEMTVEEAHNKFGTRHLAFRLWVEVADTMEDSKAVWPDMQPQNNNNTLILVFVKHFNPESQTLKGAGHLYIRRHSKVSDLISLIQQLMGWSQGTQVCLYEEIKHSMIEPLKPKQTLQQAEIQDGDIICFQKSISEKEASVYAGLSGYTDAKEFYDYLLNRINVKFCPKVIVKDEDDSFELTLNKKMSYDQFSTKVGEHLKVDPTHIRFSTVNATNGKPKAIVKRNNNLTLQQILTSPYNTYGSNAQSPNALFFEVLDLSLSELETKKHLKITWVSEGVTKEETFDILVAKNGVMSDLLPLLQKKANLDDETIRNTRIYEAHGGKVYKELSEDYSVASVNEFVTLYAERIPEEEQNAEEGDRAIYAFHFDKEPNKPHGVPFKFLVKPGELFKETKERLSKRTGIKGKQFEKIKFAIVQRSTYSKPIYLNDDDILSEVANASDDLLGLDHVNKTRSFWNRGDSIFIRYKGPICGSSLRGHPFPEEACPPTRRTSLNQAQTLHVPIADMQSSLLLCGVLAYLISAVSATALTYKLAPNEKACFFTSVAQKGAKIAFYFAVQTGGSFDVDYSVVGPNEKKIMEGSKERQGDFVFTANEVGEYRFCFNNEMSTFAEKMVDFEIAVENEQRAQLPSKQGTSPEQTSALEESIFKLSGQLSTINRNQKYFRTRENRNFSTVRSTERRIFNFSVIESLMMATMAGLQVFIVRFFFQGARKGYV